MAFKSIQTHVSDGTLESVQFSIAFLSTEHLHFYVDDVEITTSTASQGVMVDGVDEYGVTLTAAVPLGAVFKVQRQTSRDNVPHVFSTGAALFTALTTDANNEYLLYVVQETYEQSGQGPFPEITELVGTEYVTIETGGARKQITVQNFLASVASTASLIQDLADDTDPAKGPGMVGFNPSLEYVAGTVGFELIKRKSVFSTGVAATDVANMQDAITSAAPYTIIEFFGDVSFQTNATITLKPNVWLRFNGVGVTHTNDSADLFAYTPGTPTGYPGRIIIENLVANGPGTTGSANCINIDANAPFFLLKNSSISNFYGGVYLRDAYSSVIDQCMLSTFVHGVRLVRESHATTIRDTFIDRCSIAALSLNYGGGAETGAIHNVQMIGGACQNSAVGIWAENSYELHTVGVYHEGNTVHDYRIGVADTGVYGRACYGTVIDGFNSSSPCASGKNVQIEHSVGVQIRAASWNSGCSTTATLLSYDGYSDRIDVDIIRHTTTTPTNTAPVDFTSAPDRGVLRYRGRYIFGDGQTDAIQFGTLANISGKIYKGYTNSGRNALTIESLSQDIQLRAVEITRIQDGAGNDYFLVDALNQQVVAQKQFKMSGQPTGVTVGAAGGASALPATPLGYWTTQINGATVKIPYYN